ncbi:MAG: SAM-dependent methyltransferase [Deltaproteobacteria bacterium]|nr:SAM-dependent methyltransferase [Deltaproteobacteria bacterium]
MTTTTSAFIFALCQEGAEKVLREELLRAGFHPSFSSKGFVTAKAEHPITIDQLPRLVMARRLCLSLTQPTNKNVDADAAAKELSAIVQTETTGPQAKDGDVVVTVIERGAAEKVQRFVGVHKHQRGLSPDPGGDPRLEVPANAPSRAWLKFEEAARLFDLHIDRDDVVVEVGCSPGGMTRALIDRGAMVTGIDPNDMDPGILQERARFRHLRCSAQAVDVLQLPGPVRLLVVDVNQRPNAAISSIEAIAQRTRRDMRAVLFILKLGDWGHIVELPQWLERISRLFAMPVTAVQLPSNRQELAVYAAR